MPERYFKLTEDVQVPGRWYLGDPVDEHGEEVDPWMFTAGRPAQIQGRLHVPFSEPGSPLDFSTTSVGATPIIHVKVAALFTELAPTDVQLLPVDIAGQPDQYLLMVATQLVRCIDERASREVRHWKPEHGQPERVGQYRSVAGLRIDASKVGDAKVFRTWGWDIALIVSEDIKVALERIGATGVKFTEV